MNPYVTDEEVLEDREFIKYLVRQTNEKLQKLKAFSPATEINTYCDQLEQQVKATISQTIARLSRTEKVLLKEINGYRARLLEDNMTVNEQPERANVVDLQTLTTETERVSSEIRDFTIRNTVLSETITSLNCDEIIRDAESRATELSTKIAGISYRMKKHAFRGQFMRFKPNKLFFLGSNQIGDIEYYNEEFADEICKYSDYLD